MRVTVSWNRSSTNIFYSRNRHNDQPDSNEPLAVRLDEQENRARKSESNRHDRFRPLCSQNVFMRSVRRECQLVFLGWYRIRVSSISRMFAWDRGRSSLTVMCWRWYWLTSLSHLDFLEGEGVRMSITCHDPHSCLLESGDGFQVNFRSHPAHFNTKLLSWSHLMKFMDYGWMTACRNNGWYW